MSKNLSRYLDSYENITLLGDFNMTPEGKSLQRFTDTFSQKWFYDNYMVLNPGKCFHMSFGFNPDKNDLILEDSTKIPSAKEYVFLGATIDNRRTFTTTLKTFAKKLQAN